MKAVSAILAPLIVALAVLGGVGSFATVREMARPWFGESAWIVPVGMDVGIVILLAWDLLMEYLRLPWPVLRWVAWAYIAATVAVNVLAAGGNLAGSVIHAAMPVLLVTVVEGVRQLIRRWAGLAAGTRRERIPAVRWVLAPVSTVLLWRRMVLWQVTAYRHGLDLEYRHLLAVARLQERHGRWAWRWRASLAERTALRRLPAEATGHGGALADPGPPGPTPPPLSAELGSASTADAPVPSGFATVGGGTPGVDAGPPLRPAEAFAADEVPAAVAGWASAELVTAARQVVAEAERRGARLSKAAFGRRLRQQGFTIANQRLAELRAVCDEPRAKGV
ncbi:DUF2637 domain-containing protein [Actinomadura craniellae]|uniref:DUF2637 domain-containing protein n=1 Tax=Actinomadura craniellae TaxID=2231787 RepID=UPI0011BDDC86|nr:DUF2637 domain-containing protein [Actinomadura craniellae]